MSKFFDQSSSSSSESESDNEVIEVKPTKKSQMPTYESEEEEKKVRIVLPEKAKRLEEINQLVKQVKNAKKIRDIVKANQLFEEMVKSYEKAKKITEKEGHFKQYIRAIAELEDYVVELWADTEWRQAASKNNATSLTKLRQRIRRYNKDYETEIAEFKANPLAYSEEEKPASVKDSESEKEDGGKGSDSDSDSDDEVKPRRKKAAKGSDESDDSEEWDLTESDESSSEEFDMEGEDIWKKFLKGDNKESSNKRERVAKKPKEKRERDRESVSTTKTEKIVLFAKDEEINHTSVVNKLNTICSGRGRKGTDRKEQMELMTELRNISKAHNLGSTIDCKILFNQIAVSFDYNQRLLKCMKPDYWNICLTMLEELIDILMANESIQVGEEIGEEEESFAEEPFKIKGCVLTLTDRTTEEFVKILQQCDAHGNEYVERLKDEPIICTLIDRLMVYLEKKDNKQELCRVYLKCAENLYYKYDKDNVKLSCEKMDKLCKYIYTHDTTDRLRTKAMLCHIYHHSIHDRWFDARDLLLMSHLQESIDSSDVPLQILYNRTMVQVGLCAFRVGNIKESHAALLDIQVGNRAKELLAQGMIMQRNTEKTKEQELKERQRLIPFHMHINLELIECIYLVSAMLIEIPYMCSRDYETKKRLISKQFHYQLKFSERQPVVGPPENMREHVVAASRAMRNGDWRACITFLINDKMNAKVWDLMARSTQVTAMLVEKVKEETLRSYLFKYSSVYESMSIGNLAEMFDLANGHVYSVISKMIINEELMASLDEPTQTVIMHRTEPTKLQTLALQLSEKITTLMDQTERMIQIKGGEMGAFFQRNPGQQGGQQGQNRDHNNQNRDHKQGNWQNKQSNYRGNRNQGDNRDNRQHHHNKNNYYNKEN